MVFSKVYFSSYAGPRVRAEQSSFLSVNPTQDAGTMLFAGSSAERAALGGQVAAKLALQHFLSGAEEILKNSEGVSKSSEITLAAIEGAFRTANTAVYEFGHKLSAGGRMAASLISVFIRDGFIAAGRVGKGVAYLVRKGEVFPFFANIPEGQELTFVGSNSLVSIELASVPAEAGDVILAFSEPLPTGEEAELNYTVSLLLPRFDYVPDESVPSAEIISKANNRFDPKSCERLVQQVFGDKSPAFASVLAVGPDVTFLKPEYSVKIAEKNANT